MAVPVVVVEEVSVVLLSSLVLKLYSFIYCLMLLAVCSGIDLQKFENSFLGMG